MVLPLESAVGVPIESPGQIAGHSLDEWNAAYGKVERYFNALRVRNKLLLGQLVSRVLDRAIRRAAVERDVAPMQLAAEEMDHVVTEWFAQVLDAPFEGTDPLLSDRGRLALLLADMPGKWQDQFLKPGPWPDDFIRAMRENFLRAGPDFQIAQMSPRPIDLGPIAALTNLGNVPYFRILLLWITFAVLLVVLFQQTH
ncbi:MAG TPA: hypothetical protein VGO90_05625 [Chthoniobacteraceae bacterium]|jgi:hypothetical protein|nr:hypothetical protein [Chthoniobacteraceae bacterium]